MGVYLIQDLRASNTLLAVGSTQKKTVEVILLHITHISSGRYLGLPSSNGRADFFVYIRKLEESSREVSQIALLV